MTDRRPPLDYDSSPPAPSEAWSWIGLAITLALCLIAFLTVLNVILPI